MSGFLPSCPTCGGSGIFQSAYGEFPCKPCDGKGYLLPTPEQATFDASLATAARDEAIARVDANADEEWKDKAFGVVKSIALATNEFTTDDIWKVLVEKPHEPKAMGAVLKRAQAAGLIEPTEGWRQSDSVTNHRRPLRIWKSLVCGKLLID